MGDTTHIESQCPHCKQTVEVKVTIDHAVVADPDKWMRDLEAQIVERERRKGLDRLQMSQVEPYDRKPSMCIMGLDLDAPPCKRGTPGCPHMHPE